MIFIIIILAAIELACLSWAEWILRKIGEKISKYMRNALYVLVTRKQYEEMEKKIEELEKKLEEVGMEKKEKKEENGVQEIEKKDEDKIEEKPNQSVFPAEEKIELQKKIASLKANLQLAYITEQKIKAESIEKDALIKKYKDEAEQVRKEFKQSEENLESELQEIVWDLMAQEKKKKDEFEAERDEAEFDKLDEVFQEFEATCEHINVSPEADMLMAI